MSDSKVIIKDHGSQELVRQMSALKRALITVGFHEDQKAARDAEGGPNLTNAQVAGFNEFGTSTAPSRPFMRPAVDESIDQVADMEAKAIKDAGLKPVPKGRYEKIGLFVVTQIKEKIRSNVPPPNAPATLQRKERLRAKGNKAPAKTLIDTGQMIEGVTHKVKT